MTEKPGAHITKIPSDTTLKTAGLWGTRSKIRLRMALWPFPHQSLKILELTLFLPIRRPFQFSNQHDFNGSILLWPITAHWSSWNFNPSQFNLRSHLSDCTSKLFSFESACNSWSGSYKSAVPDPKYGSPHSIFYTATSHATNANHWGRWDWTSFENQKNDENRSCVSAKGIKQSRGKEEKRKGVSGRRVARKKGSVKMILLNSL